MKEALLQVVDNSKVLCAPTVGWFEFAIQSGDSVSPGRVLGTLRILNRKVKIIAPPGTRGVVVDGPVAGRIGAEYGQVLLSIGEPTASAEVEAAEAALSASAGHHEVVSPIDGIFYTRPSPDAPAFIDVGDRVTSGTTLGLVEVMKTFNPVRYGGIGAPPEGIVEAVFAVDQAEVSAGQVLFVVRDGSA
jgi:acetyl-CoA carboxylase biotin carboxyl carrier protein